MDAFSRLSFGRKKLLMQLQTESAECGLACLAMVADWHGHRTDLRTLRSQFALSSKGANLAQLVQFAEQACLRSRPVRLELDELGELQLPCILHWDMNHFVVLSEVRRKTVIIHDPAFGRRSLDIQEVGKHFTGIALELTPTANFRQVEERKRISLLALLGRIQGLWRSLLIIFVMAIALELFALAGPMFNQWVVDEVLTSADRDLLHVLAFGFALMLATQTAISLARGWSVMYLSTHLNLQWATNVFTHLLHLPIDWFERRSLGDVVSRFGSVATIQKTLTTGFIEVILDGLMAMATMAMMIIYSPKLTCVVLASVIAYTVLRVASYRPLREATEEALVLDAREQSCFLETVRGVQAIRLFGRELDRRTRWLNLMIDSVNRDVRTEKFMLWFGVSNTAVFGLSHMLIFMLGAGMVMDGAFTIGMLLSFSAFGTQFSSRMAALVNKYSEFCMLSLHAERLSDIVLTEPEQRGAQQALAQSLAPSIEFRDVSFRYGANEPWIIRNFSLKIEAGESIALVGPSGCGKSTLAKLALGILPATEGEIFYGGRPVSLLGLAAYRQAIAAVMQDDSLFAGSLAENISFFDPQADLDRIQECARLAGIHDDIEAMPMGYQTLAGDMGSTLSGGQRQRILIARALYKKPRILLLDEATSHLDAECEKRVSAAISDLRITRICVAHRAETIAMSGRVVRVGAALLPTSG